jgi:hypothetical protein
MKTIAVLALTLIVIGCADDPVTPNYNEVKRLTGTYEVQHLGNSFNVRLNKTGVGYYVITDAVVKYNGSTYDSWDSSELIDHHTDYAGGIRLRKGVFEVDIEVIRFNREEGFFSAWTVRCINNGVDEYEVNDLIFEKID